MRITIFGDIMCEPPVLKGAKQKNGEYNFDYVYENVKDIINESDYVIGNLEFPMAGEDAKYTDTYVVFNAPDSFAKATKDAGFNVVSTVNNHTLDRGVDGMIKTLKALDRIGLSHTGSFLPENGREEAFYFEVGGVKFALIAYTYTTNDRLKPDDEMQKYINYLRRPQDGTYTPEYTKRMFNWVDKVFKNFKEEHIATIKRVLGMEAVVIRPDDLLNEENAEPFIGQYISDVKLAKEKADFVICYPHVGGQFNKEPGMVTNFAFKKLLESGADAIIASHSHIVQKAYFEKDVPLAYCLGNFNMDENSSIVLKETLPAFGLAMHLYFDGKNLQKVTYTMLRSVKKKGKLTTYPVYDLYKTLKTKKQKTKLEEEVKQIYKNITGKEINDDIIKKEYEL